ncbi:MAG TPA: carboxypeptidase-like regulatory domain-containing protein [Pyrinomonadaceae bacterium]
MRHLLTQRVAATLLLSIIVFSGAVSTSRAQDIVGGAARTDLSGGAGSGTRTGGGGGGGGGGSRPKRPATRYVTNTRTVTVTKTIVKTPTTGTIVVSAEPGAGIVVESVRGGTGDEGTVPAGDRQFVFNNLAPGRYRVAAELDGYQPAEEEVVVTAGKTAAVSLDLRPITFNVNLTTNVTTGEVRYAPVVARNDPSTGEVKYERAPGGETRIMQIQNGRAVLSNLRTGTYGLDIRADEVGYQTLLATVTLPGKTDFDIKLNKLLSTKTFSATWTSLEGWEAPTSWTVATRKLSTSGPGIALPKDESYRYYSDFQLSSDAKMINGVAASFVVRAVDKQNYYLIQLTGAKSDEPYVLRGFIVRNGVPQRMGSPIPIDGFVQTLKPGQFFTVSIKGTDNSFNVSITDSQTGDVLPLGILTDPNRNFKVGAVGLAVRDTEHNEIGRFIVCTSDCPRG